MVLSWFMGGHCHIDQYFLMRYTFKSLLISFYIIVFILLNGFTVTILWNKEHTKYSDFCISKSLQIYQR